MTSSSRAQTKNVYWCENNIYSGWTSLYFKPDPIVHLRIKYVGVGNWQYTGDGTWYIKNNYRERVLLEFTKVGYRIKGISSGEAAGRHKVHNARKGTEKDYYEERRRQEKVDEERERRQRESNFDGHDRRERERRQRETNDAFDDFFGRYFEDTTKVKPKGSYKELEDAWLTIFYSLGKEHAKRLYRQAAGVLHPDRLGDEEAMKALNTAWDTFEDPKKRRR